jgi:XTP/dITP diphosphohydrolase
MTSSILVATSNPHKIQEIRAVLCPMGLEVCSLDEIGADIPEPIEDEETFAGNARIKARAYALATGRRTLADDSGLAVDALDGWPGVHSARYAGVEGTRQERDAANNAKLLDAIKDIPPQERTARFVCAICVADPDGEIIAETSGTFGGVITDTPAGDHGFGYDPLLYLPDAKCTSAELSPDAKNARSHRGAALRRLVSVLMSNGELRQHPSHDGES